MFNVIQTEEFLDSLVSSAAYIKNQLKNPVAAQRLIDAAEQAALSLEHMPHRFSFSRYEALALLGIRVLPIKNHCIFYTIDDATQTVYLHLFGYGSRNWETLF